MENNQNIDTLSLASVPEVLADEEDTDFGNEENDEGLAAILEEVSKKANEPDVGLPSASDDLQETGQSSDGAPKDDEGTGVAPADEAEEDTLEPAAPKKKTAAKKPPPKKKAKKPPSSSAAEDELQAPLVEDFAHDPAVPPDEDVNGKGQTDEALTGGWGDDDPHEVFGVTPNDGEAVNNDGGSAHEYEPPRGRDADIGGTKISTRKNAFLPALAEPERPRRKKQQGLKLPNVKMGSVLTIDISSTVATAQTEADELWHELRTSLIARRMLTGTLDGVERLENRSVIAIVVFKKFRVVIPYTEMNLSISYGQYRHILDEYSAADKMLNRMLGSDIDFVIKGMDEDARAAVGSRRIAMYRKRRHFYMDEDEAGSFLIREGRVVEARVLAVGERLILVEAFGVETKIPVSLLSWEWLGNAHEQFSVGDQTLIRVNKIDRKDVATISIEADVRSTVPNMVKENLSKCIVQGKYAGTVTNIFHGATYIRLSTGVNVIAHTCLDDRRPGKRDVVSVVVTHIDQDKGFAVGLITKIIKQNI